MKQTDPRTDPSSTPRIGYYTSGTGSIGQVAWRQDTAGNQTNYTYDSATGILSTMVNPLGKVTRYGYSPRGENIHTWGATTYPVEYAFNDYGECVSMRTYRDGANWDSPNWPGSGTADPTTWNYDPASGTLTSRTDAMNRAVGYAYDVRNQLKTRTWARGVTTNYSYSPATAEQTVITYSDGTPALSYNYNRLGQTTFVGDVTGTRSFNYSSTYTYLTQEDLGSFVGTRSVSHQYDVFGRNTYLGVGVTATPGNEYGVGYGYDAYGRMNQAWIFSYTYTPNSNLLATAAANGSAMCQTRAYETNRDLLSSITTQWTVATKAGFGYTNDILGRRTNVTETGEMFARYSSAGLARLWGYNDRSELTSDTTTLNGNGTAVSGRDFAFAYDNLGNRTTRQHFSGTDNYTTNALNQYTQIAGNVHFDVAGFAPAAATVTVNGSSAGVIRQGDYYAAGVWPGTVPFWQSQSVASSLGGNASRSAWLPGNPEIFVYDADGNMTSDGRWDYAYDAENRLVSMQTHGFLSPGIMPNADARRLEFKNDYLGRRVEKIVRAGYNGSSYTSVLADIRYLYDGWNPVFEISVSGGAMWVSRLNVWGLDWSGTLQGAGGVGGLLATYDGINPYWQLPAYDGNGNVNAMISYADGTIAAAYEYDAFGNTLRATGPAAGTNPFRFSTKNTDPETGLIYYGLRYYSPTLGRFINKDPIEEKGGLNLYAFCNNNGVNRWDVMGLDSKVWNIAENAPDDDAEMYRVHPNMKKINDTTWYDPDSDTNWVYGGRAPSTSVYLNEDIGDMSGCIWRPADPSAEIDNLNAVVSGMVAVNSQVWKTIDTQNSMGSLARDSAIVKDLASGNTNAQSTALNSAELTLAGIVTEVFTRSSNGPGNAPIPGISPAGAGSTLARVGAAGLLAAFALTASGDSRPAKELDRDIIINRLGGGMISNLALKPAEFNANPPGISAIGIVSPNIAAFEMRMAFPDPIRYSRIWADSQITGTTTLGAILSVGFFAFPSPTDRLPNHWTITHPAGISGFTPQNLAALSAVFINVPTPSPQPPTHP